MSTTDVDKKRFGTVISKFNHAFRDRVSGLLGTRSLPGDLDRNILTLILAILISEREHERKIVPDTPGFTKSTIEKEVYDLGLPENFPVSRLLQGLVQQKLIEISEHGEISVTPLLQESIDLLWRIFPKMAGLNMLAYIIQTMDEVISGRKDLESATRQFDDTLRIHGIPLDSSTATKNQKQSRPADTNPAHVLARLKDAARERASTKGRGRANIISSDNDPEIEIKSFEMSELFAEIEEKAPSPPRQEKIIEEVPQETPEEQEPEQETTDEKEEEILEQVSPETDEIAQVALTEDEPPSEPTLENSSPITSSDSEQEQPLIAREELFLESSGPREPSSSVELPEGKESDGEDLEGQGGETPEDGEIEKKIKALEEDLSLLCPLCGKGKVQQHRTPKGKIYYQCNAEACTFISWGKPIHLPCPVCKNPFLIQVENSDQPQLKCPRATCGYKGTVPSITNQGTSFIQPDVPPGPKAVKRPRRRIVRRRRAVRRPR